MRKLFKNWWTIAWLEAFEARWLEGDQVWNKGQTAFDRGQLGKREFDSLSYELSGKLFDSAIKPFYRPVILFSKVNHEQSKRITQWFLEHESSLEGTFNGHLDENLPDWMKEILFDHSVKSFYCNCGQRVHYCEHVCALILDFLSDVEKNPSELFRMIGVDLSALLPEPIAKTIHKQQSIPTFSNLLLAMASHLPQSVAPTKITAAEILSQMEDIPTYLLEVSSLFAKKGSLLEKTDFSEVVLKLITETGRFVRQALLEEKPAAGQQESSILTGTFQFSEDGSTLEWIGHEGSGFKNRARLINDWVNTVKGKEYDHIFSVLIRIAASLVSHGACLPLVFQPENGSGMLPRLLWFPPVGEPMVAKLLSTLRSIESDLLNLMNLNGLKKFSAFRILTDKDCIQNHEKARALDALLIGVLAQLMSGLIEWTNRDQKVRGLHSAMLLGRDIQDLDGLVSPDIHREICRPFDCFMAPYLLAHRPALVISEIPCDPTTPPNFIVNYRIQPGMASKDLTTQALSLETLGESLTKDNDNSSPKFLPIETLFQSQAYVDEREFWRNLLPLLGKHSQVFNWIADHQGSFCSNQYAELRTLLNDVMPFMMMLGIRFFIDKRFKKLIRPKVSISAKRSADGKVVSFFNPMSFQADISIDGEKLSEDEAQKLLSMANESDTESMLVAYRDRFVEIDPKELAILRNLKKKIAKVDPFEQLRSVITGNWNGYGLSLSKEIEQNLADILTVKEESLPSHVHAVLRDYQLKGYQWLMKNIRHRMGAVLADDMGLGKTVQVICAIAKCLEDEIFKGYPHLIVVPAGLLHNWQQEFEKFAPTIRVSLWQSNEAKTNLPVTSDVVLTTYGTLTRHFEQFSDQTWGLLVADEAQGLKNPNGARSQAFRLLKAKVVIAMTGTPVENRLMDMWSIFACVQPKLLGSKESFIERFARPIEKNNDTQALTLFKRLISPFVLRREKTDRQIISDLPNCGVEDIRVKLTALQVYLYEKTVNEIMTRMQTEERVGFLIIYLISELKRICNSPSLYLGKPSQTPDSGKAFALIRLVQSLLNEKKKVLIFTQYRQMGLKLQDWLENAIGERPLFLNGSVPLTQRTKMIEQFQLQSDKRILLITLKAGGVGLNLTAASAVIHYDLWWNPAVEQQATDRAYRIGQTQDVSVYRLICEGTFEERINDVIVSKSRLAKKVTGRSDRWLGDFSQAELEDFFKLIA